MDLVDVYTIYFVPLFQDKCEIRRHYFNDSYMCVNYVFFILQRVLSVCVLNVIFKCTAWMFSRHTDMNR